MDSFCSGDSKGREEGRLRRTFEWPAMDKVVRVADEAKVKDCKEDIDTLLVFAGLFSAVLTAFVVESYQNLQPDTSSQVVTLLAQISAQLSSFTLAPGFANSTSQALSQIVPFQPSPAMVQVNALWFASLICSLVTASLGMLVKQWLREYLGGDYYSPQARLRVRQFRHEGIAAWNVFDIAAVLPLLLQVSLGLFFLGLCIFTRSVNHAVGWTSIPLVSAWLLVFLLTTIAPAFSARCPYKVTFLISALRIIRKWARRTLTRAKHHNPVSRATSKTVSSENSSTAFDSQSSLSDLDQSYARLRSRNPQEEEEAVMSEKNDIKILLTVDSMLSDDTLVGTAFRQYIWQLHSPGEEVVDFVLQIMGRRLQRGRSIMAADLPLTDLRPLSKRAWTGLTGILADALHNEIYQDMHNIDHDDETHRVLKPWMRDMLNIIMSNSGYTFQESEADILVYSLMYDPENTAQIMHDTRRRVTAADFTDIVRLSQRTFRPFNPGDVMDCMLTIARWCVYRNPNSSETLEEAITSIVVTQEGILDVADVLISMLRAEILGQSEGQVDSWWHTWMDDALCSVIYAFTILREGDDDRCADICKLVGLLCAESELVMRKFLRCATQTACRRRGSIHCYRLLAQSMSHSSVSDRDYHQIFNNLLVVVENVADDGDLDPIHLYHIACHISDHPRPSVADDRGRLQALFAHLLTALHSIKHSTKDAATLSESCAILLETLSQDDLPADTSHIFSEDLESTLGADDFLAVFGPRKQDSNDAGTSRHEDGPYSPGDITFGPIALPGDHILASIAAPDFQEKTVLRSTPVRPRLPTRKGKVRPGVPPLLIGGEPIS